jgi:hypothetical protein
MPETTPNSTADRLEPVRDTLAELARESCAEANRDHEPGAWAMWCDLSAALAAVCSAVARDRLAEARGRIAGGATTPEGSAS